MIMMFSLDLFYFEIGNEQNLPRLFLLQRPCTFSGIRISGLLTGVQRENLMLKCLQLELKGIQLYFMKVLQS